MSGHVTFTCIMSWFFIMEGYHMYSREYRGSLCWRGACFMLEGRMRTVYAAHIEAPGVFVVAHAVAVALRPHEIEVGPANLRRRACAQWNVLNKQRRGESAIGSGSAAVRSWHWDPQWGSPVREDSTRGMRVKEVR